MSDLVSREYPKAFFGEHLQSKAPIYKTWFLLQTKPSKENAGRNSLCQDWLQILYTLLLNLLPETGIKRSLSKAALVFWKDGVTHSFLKDCWFSRGELGRNTDRSAWFNKWVNTFMSQKSSKVRWLISSNQCASYLQYDSEEVTVSLRLAVPICWMNIIKECVSQGCLRIQRRQHVRCKPNAYIDWWL